MVDAPHTLPFLSRVSKWLGKFEEIALASALLLLALLVVCNVFSRALFNTSVAAMEELSQFAIILITFLGLGYAARTGRHIRMTAFYDALPHRPRKALRMAICLVTMLLLGFFAWHAMEYVWTVRKLGSVSPALQVPLWMVYLLAPAGFLLGALHYLLAFLRNALTEGIWLSWTVEDLYADAEINTGI